MFIGKTPPKSRQLTTVLTTSPGKFTDFRRCFFRERAVGSTQLLRVRDGYRYIGLSRSGGDRAILAYAKIDIPQRAADLVCRATAAEDRPSEVIFEGIARPISAKHSTRQDISAVADPSRHGSSVITGETRIGPFEPFLGDCGIGKRESCVPGILGAASSARIAQMRRE